MKLTRTASYAVRATIQLAESTSESPVPCSRLASEGKMPERFLLQILRSLVRHGILRSTRGVDGGYALSRSPDDISLLEVIEAVEGPLGADTQQVISLPMASRLAVDRALRRVADNARRQLAAVKVSQLLSEPQGPRQPDESASTPRASRLVDSGN